MLFRYLISSIGFVLIALAIFFWPDFVRQILSLDWYVGNTRPFFYGLQTFCAMLGVATLLGRHRIATWLTGHCVSGRRLAIIIGVPLIGMALAVGLIEILLRLLDFPFKHDWTPSETALARFDPEVGWSYIPNHSAVQAFGKHRRQVAMHFDGIGARVPTSGYQRDPSAPTVFFVGGSVTMGHGVTYEESFPGQLDSSPDFPFQVVNLGLQGGGTDQALLLVKRHMNQFNVRAVVYGFLCAHVRRNAVADRRVLYPDAKFVGTKPRFEIDRNGILFLRDKPERYDGFAYSRVWAYLQVAWSRYGPVPNLNLTISLIREMKNYVEDRGAKLLILYWPLTRYAWICGPTPFLKTELDVVHVFDNDFLVRSKLRKWTIPGDGHPDANAHAYVAKLLLKEFKHRGWLTPNGHERHTARSVYHYPQGAKQAVN